MLAALLVVGCGNKGSLEADPAEIAWGEIDFQQEMPEGGYTVQTVSLISAGEDAVEPTIVAFDFDHLCLEGFEDVPATIPALEPGDVYVLNIGVCGYDPAAGERDSVVSGEIGIEHTGGDSPLVIPWSFTPTEEIGQE